MRCFSANDMRKTTGDLRRIPGEFALNNRRFVDNSGDLRRTPECLRKTTGDLRKTPGYHRAHILTGVAVSHCSELCLCMRTGASIVSNLPADCATTWCPRRRWVGALSLTRDPLGPLSPLLPAPVNVRHDGLTSSGISSDSRGISIPPSMMSGPYP